VTRSYNISMFQADGSWVLVVVSVPVLLALVPVLIRYRAARIVSAALLGGVLGRDVVRRDLFVPAAIVMTIAAAWHESAPVPPMPSNRTTD
jgi:hypothetical protein